MVDPTPEQHPAVPLDLKNPALAAFLAWAVPGLGHLYQGRTTKGWLFMVCILGLFFTGIVLGSHPDVGWGRVVYWTRNPIRLQYLCQAATGVVAMPALVQYHWSNNGKTSDNSPLGRLMWPPGANANRNGNEADELHRVLNRNFELGQVYTVIAGLLNIFVIFDAYAGPAPVIDDKKKKKTAEKSTETPDDKNKKPSEPASETSEETVTAEKGKS